jgi:uncharacterized protein YggE
VPRLAMLAVATAAVAAVGCAASPRPPRTPVQAGAPSAPAASSPAQPATASMITATGHGTASGAPDLLTITLGVQTNGPTAHGVLETNNAEAAALIAKLRADGIAADDIQTAQLSLNPVYDNERLTGFQATDTVTARARQLDRAGSLVDDAVAAGGADSQVQSLVFSVQDSGPLLAAAHADAVRQAVAEARAMAAAAGVSLGALKAVTDASPPQVVPYATAAAASPPGAKSSVPLQPGTEQVTADVTVSYALA